LIHHPVVDKNGQTITAAVTALDLHDIARAARTYGIGAYYVVTPLTDQQALVAEIVDHWVSGFGASYNPDRREALTMIRVKSTLEEVVTELSQNEEVKPQIVVTSARMADSDLSYAGLRDLNRDQRPLLLLFGTAWGLAPEVLAQADYRLAPIRGGEVYNHLSVRSAAAIILDRLLGEA
jgi:hypothetical protein